MSNIEHIHKQHKGWSNNRGKPFWEKRAQQVRRDVEERDLIITFEPTLQRFIAITYVLFARGSGEITAHFTRENISERRAGYALKKMRPNKLVSLLPTGAYITKTKKMWCVKTNLHHGRIWVRLELAQAERDGLQLHYARHLMTKGTGAAGT